MRANQIAVTTRCMASALFLALTLGPSAESAFAATLLADTPIAAKVSAKPNIVYTLDDSGSMNLTYIPDYVVGAPGYCRHTNGQTIMACNASFVWGRDLPMFAAEMNRLYYNPDVTYDPPVDKNGRQSTSLLPDPLALYQPQDAAHTTNWTKVYRDPYLTPAVFDDLVTLASGKGLVSVPVWCNTDWPVDLTYGTTRASGNASDGEYKASTGSDCRINGTRYDAYKGAPAVIDNYNYPWQKTSGANLDQYYWRTGGNRTIWCNNADPRWPRYTGASCNNLGTGTCNAGTPVTTSIPQTCNFTGNTTTCTSTTYSPAGCNSWAPGIGQPVGGCIGTVGVECLACNSNCGSTAITGRNGQCSISGAACNCAGAGCTLPACPNVNQVTGCSVPGAVYSCKDTAACSRKLWDTVAQAPSVTTMLQDSNVTNGGTGAVCRHNNYPGPGYTSGRFTYSAAPYTSAVNDSSCGAMPASTLIDRHYYTVDSVRFCPSTIATANDPWRGFGTGLCQSKNDLTTNKNVTYGQFHRIALVNDGRTFAWTDPITGIPGTPRSYAAEMTNYANWYAYYRSRLLAGKTTASIAFNSLDNTYRVGLHTLYAPNIAANYVDLGDFTPAQKSSWYTKLFAVTGPAGAQTYSLDALLRIGDLIEKGAGSAGLPAHNDPLYSVAGNQVTCQNNYHVFFTDGTTNQLTLPTTVQEKDGSPVPPATPSGWLPPDPDPVNHPEITVATLHGLAGSPWPRPYLDTAPTANTLADIGLYYWGRDLRPTLKDNVPSADGRLGADVDPSKDPAWWQHLSVSAISFGAEGKLDATNVNPALAAVTAGTQNWPAPVPPNQPATPTYAVDDLWHATVNSRGKFVFAKSPLEVAFGLGSILAGIQNNQKARVGASFLGQALDLTNNVVYQATVQPGWAGDLAQVRIDPTNANPLGTNWRAGPLLDTLLATPAPGTSPAVDSDNAWFKKRRVVAWNTDANKAVPFTYTAMSAAGTTQLNTLGANPTVQQKVVAYLRGGSTFGPGPNPAQIEGTSLGQYRQRFGKLGDITNSQPVIVGAPSWPFKDADDAGYSAYKAAWSARATRVFVGANDGMVHAFDGSIPPSATMGTEVFAYIPSVLFTTAKDDGGKFDRGLQALTYQDGGYPIYKHHFYVDATARAMDVDFNNCGTNQACASDWRTIVVGGLGKGGPLFYAIDATDPSAGSEAAAAAKILWEFKLPGSQVSYGRPIIAKTYADGWVVIIASGYNNTDASVACPALAPNCFNGKGHLYFLKVSDGSLIRSLTTTGADTGNAANPSGLTQIGGWTKDYANQFVEQIYGGDLNGNVWRWDVHDPVTTNWTVDLFAQLSEPVYGAQPVTTEPEIAVDLNNGVDRYVFIGTGRLLHVDDFTTPSPEQGQTMYAIRDGTLTTPLPAGSLPITKGMLKQASGIAPIAGGVPDGWYEDLPLGQRIVINPIADLNLVGYVGTAVQPDPCLTSLPAFIYARDYTTGESVIASAGGAIQPSISAPEGAVGLQIVGLQDPSSSFPTLSLVYSKETNANIVPLKIKPRVLGGGHRMSWRLLTGQ